MDLMHRHLTQGTELPPSQVLRSRPRALVEGGVEDLTPAHLGELVATPGANAITMRERTLRLPD